jgi:hypothetical protein
LVIQVSKRLDVSGLITPYTPWVHLEVYMERCAMRNVRPPEVVIEVGPCRVRASGAFAIVIVALVAAPIVIAGLHYYGLL